jgi:hypothetical protein
MLTATYLTTDGSQYFSGYACETGETLIQTSVTTDRTDAHQTIVDGLFDDFRSGSEDGAPGYTDATIKSAIMTAVTALPFGSIFFHLDTDADDDCLDLNVYMVIKTTYNVR